MVNGTAPVVGPDLQGVARNIDQRQGYSSVQVHRYDDPLRYLIRYVSTAVISPCRSQSTAECGRSNSRVVAASAAAPAATNAQMRRDSDVGSVRVAIATVNMFLLSLPPPFLDCAVPCPNISTASRSECAASCSACTAEPYMCDQWAYGEGKDPNRKLPNREIRCNAAAMRLCDLAACFRATACSYFAHLFLVVWKRGLLASSLANLCDRYKMSMFNVQCSPFILLFSRFSRFSRFSCPHLRSPGHPVTPTPYRARPKLLPV